MGNKALYMDGKMNLGFMELPVPEAAEGEIVLRVEYVGICGSDVHFYETGCIGVTPIIGKHVLGHECAGVVAEVGKGVSHLKIGDRVALEPGEGCGECEFCKSGRYNLCPDMKFISSPPYQGAMCHYIRYPAHLAFKLPENVSTMEGVLMEPLAVGIHAAIQSGVKLGDTVVILGAGCIGLTTLLACRAMSASRIIVTDLYENRLRKAKEMGADEVLDGSVEILEKIMELTDGKGADIVFETAGSRVTAMQTEQLAKRGGLIMVVGNVMGETPMNFYKMIKKELSLKTVFRYRNVFPLAIQAVADGRIRLKALATDIFAFDDAIEAFEKARTKKEEVVKVVLKLGE